ncbi:MAG: dockerin type I domain-containing protein, partial [Pirellulales bacterium]
TQGLIDESGAFQGGSAFFSTDEVPLFSVRMRANAVGQADFATDPADNRPLHDSLVFQPPSAVGINQITYGTTSLFIGDPAAVLFMAIDDSVTVNANSGNVFIGSTTMQVMNNDLKGLNTPVVITSVTPIGNFSGDVQRTNNNTTIQYSAPPAGFVGVQQFRYTLTNALGATSTAVVTMNVGSSSVNNADDLANIRLEATNNTGSPITSVTVGNTFQIRAFVSDLRSDDGDGNAATDNRGLYAAYLDVLYSYQNAEFVSIEFNTVDYNNGKKGDGQIPGIVDEIGAFQTSSSALGAGEVRLFTINMRAKAAGTFTYQGNPRDVTPLNDVTLFSPPTNLTVAQVRLNSGTVTINGSGAGGEAEFTNPSNAMDVNGDGFVTPLDVLLVINDMNNNGSRALVTGAGGEAGASRVYLDVNRDLHVTPIDALLVVNYLNEGPNGEGEAAADPLSVALDSLAPENSTVVAGIAAASDASASNSTSNSVVAVVASSGAKQLVVEDDSDSDEDASLERLLDELAGDVAEGWAIS